MKIGGVPVSALGRSRSHYLEISRSSKIHTSQSRISVDVREHPPAIVLFLVDQPERWKGLATCVACIRLIEGTGQYRLHARELVGRVASLPAGRTAPSHSIT